MTDSLATPGATVLETRDLSVSFRNGDEITTVTHGVSFEVKKGETLAIVGESGSGKTITAMSVLDLLPANAERHGSISYRGEELGVASPARMRAVRGKEIAMIFQEPMTALNPVYTVGKQLVDAIRVHERLSRSAARSRAAELLDVVGIPNPTRRLRSFPHQLSGGQRQRVMIAMAISGDPDLLIADEPTTALDVTVQAEVLDLLKRLQDEFGMAIVLITHDMGIVAETADRVIVMRDGEVVEESDVFQLFAQPAHEYTRKLLAAVPRLSNRDSHGAANDRALVDGEEFGPRAQIESVSEARDVESIVSNASESAALAVEDLHVRYKGGWRKTGFLAVEGVSFAIPQGTVMALVGESGSGKSTIGKAIVGLAPIESGTVHVSGKAVTGQAPAETRRIRREYSMVFQDPASSLNPRSSIGESIAEPLVVHRRDMSATQRHARVVDLLDQVHLPADWHERFPHELSGGQRQRIGIARALALNPKLLIADEPTAALDVSVQATVLDILQELQEQLGFSCLFISHDLAVVEKISNHIVVLQKGQVVESGGTTTVLGAPRHDYTKRLVNAAPIPDPAVRRPL